LKWVFDGQHLLIRMQQIVVAGAQVFEVEACDGERQIERERKRIDGPPANWLSRRPGVELCNFKDDDRAGPLKVGRALP
jgi:hypothetical protein